jgi:leucyl-tRNA synthetase
MATPNAGCGAATTSRPESPFLLRPPRLDVSASSTDVIELPVQVNSKLRGKILLPPASTKEQIEALVNTHADLPVWTGGKKIQKIIVVPGRIVNLICP